VAQLTKDIGFDAVDCGPLKSCTEPAMANLIIAAYKYGAETKWAAN
jgi:predicted dinucleotide-binding enzyme